MFPGALFWAVITCDSSFPDPRPGVASPERILAGLSDADKMAIMGPQRYAMYKDGKPLADFVQVVPNQDWGPNTRVRPLRELI